MIVASPETHKHHKELLCPKKIKAVRCCETSGTTCARAQRCTADGLNSQYDANLYLYQISAVVY